MESVTSSGAYINVYTNALGCDSTHTLNLTIIYSTSSVSSATAYTNAVQVVHG